MLYRQLSGGSVFSASVPPLPAPGCGGGAKEDVTNAVAEQKGEVETTAGPLADARHCREAQHKSAGPDEDELPGGESIHPLVHSGHHVSQEIGVEPLTPRHGRGVRAGPGKSGGEPLTSANLVCSRKPSGGVCGHWLPLLAPPD